MARLSATTGSTGFLWWQSKGVERRTGMEVRGCIDAVALLQRKQINAAKTGHGARRCAAT